MANLGDGFKDIFLAGIGAMAITGEKTKDLVEQLIAKGELTVDQGKQINSELKHKAEDAANAVRYDVLEACMSVMTPEERAAYAAKATELAAKVGTSAAGGPDVGDASAVAVENEENASAACAEKPADASEGAAAPKPQTPGA